MQSSDIRTKHSGLLVHLSSPMCTPTRGGRALDSWRGVGVGAPGTRARLPHWRVVRGGLPRPYQAPRTVDTSRVRICAVVSGREDLERRLRRTPGGKGLAAMSTSQYRAYLPLLERFRRPERTQAIRPPSRPPLGAGSRETIGIFTVKMALRLLRAELCMRHAAVSPPAVGRGD